MAAAGEGAATLPPGHTPSAGVQPDLRAQAMGEADLEVNRLSNPKLSRLGTQYLRYAYFLSISFFLFFFLSCCAASGI